MTTPLPPATEEAVRQVKENTDTAAASIRNGQKSLYDTVVEQGQLGREETVRKTSDAQHTTVAAANSVKESVNDTVIVQGMAGRLTTAIDGETTRRTVRETAAETQQVVADASFASALNTATTIDETRREADGTRRFVRDGNTALSKQLNKAKNTLIATVVLTGVGGVAANYALNHLPQPAPKTAPADGARDFSAYETKDGSKIRIEGKNEIVVPTGATKVIRTDNPNGLTQIQIGAWNDKPPEGDISLQTPEGTTTEVGLTAKAANFYNIRMDETNHKLLFSPNGKGSDKGFKPFSLSAPTTVEQLKLLDPEGRTIKAYEVGKGTWQKSLGELSNDAASPEQTTFTQLTTQEKRSSGLIR